MLDFLKTPVETFQDFVLLSGRAFKNIFRSPHYADDIFQQMDIIGVGSLPIVLMIGFFSGSVNPICNGVKSSRDGSANCPTRQ